MRRLLFTIAIVAAAGAAAAQQVPVKQAPIIPGAKDKLTIRECMGILVGLNALDGRKVIVGQGKPTETIEILPYKFGVTVERGTKLRNSISHNLYVLGQVQQEAQAANRRAQIELGKGEPVRADTKEGVELDRRNNDYLDRPCNVELDHLRDDDLRIGENDIPGSILSLLWKIRDRGEP